MAKISEKFQKELGVFKQCWYEIGDYIGRNTYIQNSERSSKNIREFIKKMQKV